jgi:hypothetical protein
LTIVAIAAIAFVPAGSALAEEETGMRGEVKFSGVIVSVPVAAGQPWVIAGVQVAVNAQTEIRLTTGTVTPGMWADVTARRQEDSSLLASRIVVLPAEARLKGPIQARPAAPEVIGNWLIAGQTIVVTAETRISQRGAPLEVGNWAEVFYVEQSTGSLTAVRLRGLEPRDVPLIEVYGAIQSFNSTSWTLSGITVAITEDTTIMGTPQVGLLAQATAQLQEGSNALVAEHLRVAWMESGGRQRPVQFTGAIERLPGGNLNGIWQVNGRQVEVTGATVVHQERHPAAVGNIANVIGRLDGNVVRATQIIVLRGSGWGEEYVFFAGRIEALPTGGLLGEWTVAGRQFTVGDGTRVEGARFAHVGGAAQVGALTQPDETLVAAWVRVLPLGPRPSVTP